MYELRLVENGMSGELRGIKPRHRWMDDVRSALNDRVTSGRGIGVRG